MPETMVLYTPSENARVLFTTNVTAATITEPVPTTTEPTDNGSGIISMGKGGMCCPSGVKLWFFGVGTASDIKAAAYGWEFVPRGSAARGLWMATVLATFKTITLDTGVPGVDGTPVTASGTVNIFASAIALDTVGNSGISVEVVSGGSAQIGHVIVSSKGPRYIEVRMLKGSATSVNCVGKPV